jgi:hypothetical protein
MARNGTAFDDLGFKPSYMCVVNPEFPPSGFWTQPFFDFSTDGSISNVVRENFTAPLLVRISARDRDDWIGRFDSGIGGGSVSGAFACPNGQEICVLVGGNAYVVDVLRPETGSVIRQDQIYQVLAARSLNLLLLVRNGNIVAIGENGVAWDGPMLTLDELSVEDIDEDSALCRGWQPGGFVNFIVNLRSGERMSDYRLV